MERENILSLRERVENEEQFLLRESDGQFGGGKYLVCVRNWAWMDKESFGNVNGEEKGGENSSLEIAKKYTIFSVILDLFWTCKETCLS